jgi:malto-oligosyltrehalose synthase
VAAKAVEDTGFYRYGRLLSRNDVGSDAARLGAEPAVFHADNVARFEHFPHALLATATHDHKRGEDVRARLAVLSEIPDLWQSTVQRWMQANAALRPARGPEPGDEAQLYQMIVGAWPTMLSPTDHAGCAMFVERLAAWQRKAIREAKLQGDWTGPDDAYEAAAHDFLVLLMSAGSEFAFEAAEFAQWIAPAGAVNALAQTLLKLTSPGVPDFFQGTEFWDLSLVDPDNRRPVDFTTRRQALRDDDSPALLAAHWRDGRVKQALISGALTLRQRLPALFSQGEYHPLEVEGPLARHVIAFMRVLGESISLTVVPRLSYRLIAPGDHLALARDVWGDTALRCPPELQGRRLQSILGDNDIESVPARLPVARILKDFVVSLHGAIEIA